jgi:hypothetical protein
MNTLIFMGIAFLVFSIAWGILYATNEKIKKSFFPPNGWYVPPLVFGMFCAAYVAEVKVLGPPSS